MISWIEEHWPKSTIFLAVYSTILIFLFVLEIDFALFLIWIQLPVYWLHQFEEYVFPGGFLETFNKKVLGSNENEWPIAHTQYTKLYLSEQALSLSLEAKEKTEETVYSAKQGKALFNFKFDEEMELSGYMKLRVWVEARPENTGDASPDDARWVFCSR